MNYVPLRYLVALNRVVLPESTDDDFKFRYIDISQVLADGSVRMPGELTRFSDAPSRARRVALAGDTIISTVRTYLRAIAEIPVSADPLIFSTGFAVLEPCDIESRFLAYACRSHDFVGEVVSRSSGVSYPAINPPDLLSIAIHLPETEVQVRIAEFLDDRVARIDRIVAARRQQIAAALEARDESIRRLTTTADAEVKGTGINWMPSIASDSQLPRVAHTFRTGSGSTPPSNDGSYYDGGVPWVNTGDVRDGPILTTSRAITDRAMSNFSTLVKYPPGSLVVAMYGQGTTKGRVGLLGVSACVNQACCVLSAEGDLTNWAFHWFRAHKRHIIHLAMGAGQPNLSQEIIRALRIPIPPERVRRSLLMQIEGEETRVLRARSAMARQIDLLTEYKSSLITAAVTGELDVTTAGSGIPG